MYESIRSFLVGLAIVVIDTALDTFLLYAVSPEWLKSEGDTLLLLMAFRAARSGAMYYRQSPIVKKYVAAVDNADNKA